MKKKLFFILLSGSIFLNFNIADANDHVFRIIGDGWGSAGGGSPLEPTINW